MSVVFCNISWSFVLYFPEFCILDGTFRQRSSPCSPMIGLFGTWLHQTKYSACWRCITSASRSTSAICVTFSFSLLFPKTYFKPQTNLNFLHIQLLVFWTHPTICFLLKSCIRFLLCLLDMILVYLSKFLYVVCTYDMLFHVIF